MGDIEDNYYRTMFFVKQHMIQYAQEQEIIGNLGQTVRRIIMKTGAPGKLFKSIKFHLFGLRDNEMEQIEIQHSIRQQMKLKNKEIMKSSSPMKSISPIKALAFEKKHS